MGPANSRTIFSMAGGKLCVVSFDPAPVHAHTHLVVIA
jgi:hypothetical protein